MLTCAFINPEELTYFCSLCLSNGTTSVAQMCNAWVVFCRNEHCFGVIGWYILQPCLPAYLADCREGHPVFDHAQRDWTTFRNGCRLPRTEARERSGNLRCVGCSSKAMDSTMASAKAGVGKGLLGRRVQRAMSQGRDLFGEVGGRHQMEAAVHGSTSASSDLRDTTGDELDTDSLFADDAGLPTNQLFAGSAAGSGTEGAETQEHAPGATRADGLRGPGQPSLQVTTSTASEPRARASDDPASPSYYLDAEDIPPNLTTPVQPTEADDSAASVANYPPAGFQEPAMGETGLPFPFGTGHVAAEFDFSLEGDVLDQGVEFWDMMVGPDDGSLAYVLDQSEDVPGAKRRRSEDAGDPAEGSARGSKRQRMSRG